MGTPIDLRAQRGASIRLCAKASDEPPAVMHYEAGPVVMRQFEHAGTQWLVLHEAEHDGIGWLVLRTFCRPLVLLPDDYLHIRVKLLEDHGKEVVVEGEGGRPVRFARKDVVYIEERPAAEGIP